MVTGHIRKRTTKDGKASYQIILETDRDPITGQRQRMYQTVNGTKKEAEAMLNNQTSNHSYTKLIAADRAMTSIVPSSYMRRPTHKTPRPY